MDLVQFRAKLKEHEIFDHMLQYYSWGSRDFGQVSLHFLPISLLWDILRPEPRISQSKASSSDFHQLRSSEVRFLIGVMICQKEGLSMDIISARRIQNLWHDCFSVGLAWFASTSWGKQCFLVGSVWFMSTWWGQLANALLLRLQRVMLDLTANDGHHGHQNCAAES